MLKNKVVNNASWIIGVKIIQTLLTLLVTMFTARYLGPSNYGVIEYAAAVVAFFAPVAMLGLNEVIVQELIVNPKKEGEIMGSAIGTSCIAALVCMLGVAAFALIANHGERETIIVCILYSFMLLLQGMNLISYWFQAHYLAKYSSIAAFLAYFAASAYKILILALGKNVYWFAVSNAVESCLVAVGLLLVFRKISGCRMKFRISESMNLVKKSMYYVLPNIMIAVFGQTDRIMLKFFIDEAATGLYSAAFTCAGIGGFVMTAIIDSARPSVFEGMKESEEVFNLRLRQLYCVIIYISIAKNLFITVLARPIVNIVFGAQYLEAVSTLRWITWYITFSEIGVIRNIWILSKNLQKWLIIINVSGAAANILLNALLIPIWGTAGAAIATVITQIVANVVVTYIIKPVRPSTVLMLESLDIRLILDYFRKKAD